MRRLAAHALALFAPPGCPACRAALTGVDERLCTSCARSLPWLRGGCPRCGLPSHRGRRCPAATAAFPRAWAPVAYEGVAQRLVAALKFHGALSVADLMAAQMAANLPAPLRASDAALVPVPGLASRRRARGFDPAAVLAGALARRTGRPVHACLERRDRGGARQVGASRAARRAPGRLVIVVAGTPPRRALLVDDVHTTGATLDACARALASAGVTVVAALSYARTQ